MADLDKIRARERDPAAHANSERIAAAVSARLDNDKQRALMQQAVRAASVKAKVIVLRQLADNIGRAAAGLVPCTKGCDHCCKMDTLVSEQEARQIAQETGAFLADCKPGHDHVRAAERQRFSGVPCTFLTEAGCAIYAFRPYACRVHYVADSDSLLCEIVPGQQIRAPHLNVNQYDTAAVEALSGGNPLAMRYADVRAFFPHGLGKKR
ncbi:MAG: YkgJ family cysteine cluster protein [Telluria sp.]